VEGFEGCSTSAVAVTASAPSSESRWRFLRGAIANRLIEKALFAALDFCYVSEKKFQHHGAQIHRSGLGSTCAGKWS
jgi:hypothetical protein